MNAKKIIHVVGDMSHREVMTLLRALENEEIEVQPAHVGEHYKILLFCLTEVDLSKDAWRILDVNITKSRIMPALFTGGKMPAILAGIVGVNFATNPQEAVAKLVKAINHSC